MKKKILLVSMLATTVLASGTLAGCSAVSDALGGIFNWGEEDNPPVTYEVSLEEETLIMTVGDEQFLLAEFDAQAGATLSYTSSDESVVKVDEYGKLTAMSVGTATITAHYGDAVDACVVTVSLNGMLPLLQLPNVPSTEIYMQKSSELNLSGTVLFNSKTYEDVTLTYELSDPDAWRVENGVFTSLKAGTTEITVSATWRGISGGSMTKKITVEVIIPFLFLVNDGINEITLYTKSDTVSPFVVTVEYDGEPLQTNIEITAGNEYISYDAETNTVTSLGVAGEAEITITYTLENELVVEKIPVHVKHQADYYEENSEKHTVGDFNAAWLS